MQVQTMAGWLEELGSDAPAPGGGAAAAVLVATGAALVEMVTNLTIGKPRYAEHEDLMIEARDGAAALRRGSLELAAADEAAYNAVIATYRLPKDDPTRSAAIADATAAATEPQLQTAQFAAEVIALARRILPGANVNLRSDIAVAVASARAGLESAAVLVEGNVAGLRDPQVVENLTGRLAVSVAAASGADQIIAAVRAS
ncbi:MAG TPA: cyclodeaminase/cyclohydrolase family protein [Micromonosporaceae bacterium]|jgi:formiminotetrahydrofolate cyclodeaminase